MNSLSGQKLPSISKSFEPLSRTGASTLASPPVRPQKVDASRNDVSTTRSIGSTTSAPRFSSRVEAAKARTSIPSRPVSSSTTTSSRALSTQTRTSNTILSKSSPRAVNKLSTSTSRKSSLVTTSRSSQKPASRSVMATRLGVAPIVPPVSATSEESTRLTENPAPSLMVSKPSRYAVQPVDEGEDVLDQAFPLPPSQPIISSGKVIVDSESNRSLNNKENTNLQNPEVTNSVLPRLNPMTTSPHFTVPAPVKPSTSSKSAFALSIDPIQNQSGDAHFLQLQSSTETFSLNSTDNSALNQGMYLASDSEMECSPRSTTVYSPKFSFSGSQNININSAVLIQNHRTGSGVRTSESGLETPYASYVRPPQKPGVSTRPRAFSFDSASRSSDRSMEVVLLNMPKSIFPKSVNKDNSQVLIKSGKSPLGSGQHKDTTSLEGSPYLAASSSPVERDSFCESVGDGDMQSGSALNQSMLSTSTSSIGCEVFLDRTAWSQGKSPTSGMIHDLKSPMHASRNHSSADHLIDQHRRVVVDAHAMAYVTQMAAQMSLQSKSHVSGADDSGVLSESFLSDSEERVNSNASSGIQIQSNVHTPHIDRAPSGNTPNINRGLFASPVAKPTRTPTAHSIPATTSATATSFRTPVSTRSRVRLENREVDDIDGECIRLQDPVARQLLLSDGLEYLLSQSNNTTAINATNSPISSEIPSEKFFSPVKNTDI